MIRSIEEKLYKEQQIVKLEKILLSFKSKLLPGRELQYKIMAKPYVKIINGLREEIEAYTGMQLLKTTTDDINIHIEGPAIRYGSAPISVVSSFLDNFRKTVQKYYINLNSLECKKITKYIAGISDFELSSFQPGSINVSLTFPEQQLSFFDQNNIENSIVTLFNILKWVNNNDECIVSNLSESLREKLLIQTLRTLPDNKSIKKITFYGKILEEDERITVNYETRLKAKDKIKHLDDNEEYISVSGRIRELDLDKSSFLLRNIEGYQGELKCKFPDEIADDTTEYLNSEVVVNGIKKDGVVNIKYIEKI